MLCARLRRRRRLRAASESLTHVPGRFERVDCGQPFTVVVDYAHTDDALRNLTALAREFVSRGGGDGQSADGVRLRRRSRSRQASADGRGRRPGQRFCGAHFRQSAQRRSAGHHQRRARGTAEDRSEVQRRSRSPQSDCAGHWRSAARRHRSARGQGTRESAGDARRIASV